MQGCDCEAKWSIAAIAMSIWEITETLRNYYGDQIKEKDMDGSCNKHGRDEIWYTEFLLDTMVHPFFQSWRARAWPAV
jgi:hypothetical protein